MAEDRNPDDCATAVVTASDIAVAEQAALQDCDTEVRKLGMWFAHNGVRRGDHEALEKAARLKSLVDEVTLDLMG